MKQAFATTLLGYLLAALSAAAYTASASANAAAECRQEAVDYGISEELVEEYVNGCLASRGELMVNEVSDMEYVPPAEAEDEQVPLEEPPMGDEDAAQ
jgi:hypothetical protein